MIIDPFEKLDEFFEADFQKFMRGEFTAVLEEDWERYYAAGKKKPTECPHGKSPLTCSKCYFNS